MLYWSEPVSLLLALDSVLDSMLGKDVLLKQYQMNRLLVFINPESDTSQSGITSCNR